MPEFKGKGGGGPFRMKGWSGYASPAKDANPHTTTATHKAHGAGSTVSDEHLTRYMNVSGEEKPLTGSESKSVEKYIKTESDKATKAGKSWTTMGEIRRRRGETKDINE